MATKQIQEDKPPYKIPSMQEISEIPWNGYNVISTFSGCGGSSLGYKLAGFKVLWANEFIPIAADTYERNHKGTIVDRRDIRQIQPEEILEVIGMKKGELDIFDGSPPCQAFSTAGKREKGWGKDKQYDNGISQKNETLFDEYIRILDRLLPKVFIAENVSGLVKGTAKGYFIEILQALKQCGYNVKAKLLDAQWLGVPQMRQRIIFIGVRNDIGLEPCYPKPLSYRYTVRDAFYNIENKTFNRNIVGFWQENKYPLVKEGTTGIDGKYFNMHRLGNDKTSPTVCKSTSLGGFCGMIHPKEHRDITIEEAKRICAFPDDFELLGKFSQQWACLGNAVPPMMMYYIAKVVQEGILNNISTDKGVFVERNGQKIGY